MAIFVIEQAEIYIAKYNVDAESEEEAKQKFDNNEAQELESYHHIDLADFDKMDKKRKANLIKLDIYEDANGW